MKYVEYLTSIYCPLYKHFFYTMKKINIQILFSFSIIAPFTLIQYFLLWSSFLVLETACPMTAIYGRISKRSSSVSVVCYGV
jgi:hypothetical protein